MRMDIHEALRRLQQFVLDLELPRTDLSLFGIKCPYCGKSDRIRQLEPPGQLREELEPETLEQYEALWSALAGPDGTVGVCKFCQNPLRIVERGGRAEILL